MSLRAYLQILEEKGELVKISQPVSSEYEAAGLLKKGEPVEIGMNEVAFQAWRANVGRVAVYLLDANRPENEQHFRDLTLRVYGGDSTTRIMQEILLGIGGIRLLRGRRHRCPRRCRSDPSA